MCSEAVRQLAHPSMYLLPMLPNIALSIAKNAGNPLNGECPS